MIVRLLDVNVLVSLLDSAHVHHAAALTWFRAVAAAEGWATCPLTENGLIRVVSHFSYPNLRLSPACAAESLGIPREADISLLAADPPGRRSGSNGHGVRAASV